MHREMGRVGVACNERGSTRSLVLDFIFVKLAAETSRLGLKDLRIILPRYGVLSALSNTSIFASTYPSLPPSHTTPYRLSSK